MTANSDTLARILDGALAALARRGGRKLSMSDVCAQARISRGTLYRYFSNKDQLLDAIAAHVERGLRAELRAAVQRRPDLRERVYVVVKSLVQYRDKHP